MCVASSRSDTVTEILLGLFLHCDIRLGEKAKEGMLQTATGYNIRDPVGANKL